MTSQELYTHLQEQLNLLVTIGREEGVVAPFRPLPVPIVRPFVEGLFLCLDGENARQLIRKDRSAAAGFLAIAQIFVASLKEGRSSSVVVEEGGKPTMFLYLADMGRSYLDELEVVYDELYPDA